MNGYNVSIYSDANSSDTAGGADSITLGAVTSSTVYGASGSDTPSLTEPTLPFMSTWVQMQTGSKVGAVASSTLIGGAANDTFSFSGTASTTSITGGAGADTFAISGVSTDSTILGGAGNDTANFTAKIVDGYISVGAGADLISASADVSGTTLLGGASNDTFNLTGSDVTGARIIAGDGADVINFSANVSTTSIVGGAGNDSITYDLEALDTGTGSSHPDANSNTTSSVLPMVRTPSASLTHLVTVMARLVSPLPLILRSELQLLSSSTVTLH